MTLFALDPSWSDFYTQWGFIVGVIGLVVGVIGFGVTVWQVLETKRAAVAAREAATRTLAESKKSFARFVVGFASRLAAEFQRAANASDWKAAELRAHDLAELLATLPEFRDPLDDLVGELRAYEQKFAAPGGAAPKFARAKWTDFLARLHARLDRLKAPFSDTPLW